MAKHPRKRQKTSKEIQPLGINHLLDDDSKDDEERRLESMLFGTKFIPRGDGENGVIVVDDDDDEPDVEDAGKALGNLMDSDLFFVDDATGFDNDSESEDSEPDDSSSETNEEEIIQNPLLKSRKPPAWTDPSDPPIVSLASSRLRKLRDAPSESELTGREYEARLRRQYERINPEPSWAAKARKTKSRVPRPRGDDEDGDEEEDVHDLTSSTAGILAHGRRKSRITTILPSGTLAIERLRDANQASQASGSGEVKVVAFHPSENVPILCVGTSDKRIRLFNIDGHTSPLLQTLHVPSLPLTSPTSAQFHPLGSHILLTGPRPFYFVHDLQSGVTAKHTRGLWGTTFSSVNDGAGTGRKRGRSATTEGTEKGGGGGEGMEICAFSPHTGDILAVAGRGGYVHLVDWKSGAGQVIGSLKCGAGGGGVRSLWWVPPGVDAADGQLAVLSGDAEVYLWDVGERKCVRRWKDEGGFRGAGKVMTGSKNWLAVGSNTGFVNVYGSDSFAAAASTTATFSSDSKNPKPIKTIANLTTAISTLKFNHDAQILAMASKEKKDAMRLIHLPTLTSFANWPTSSTPLGHVTAVDFSARSEYVAVGNTRGRVLLYHLREFGVPA